MVILILDTEWKQMMFLETLKWEVLHYTAKTSLILMTSNSFKCKWGKREEAFIHLADILRYLIKTISILNKCPWDTIMMDIIDKTIWVHLNNFTIIRTCKDPNLMRCLLLNTGINNSPFMVIKNIKLRFHQNKAQMVRTLPKFSKCNILSQSEWLLLHCSSINLYFILLINLDNKTSKSQIKSKLNCKLWVKDWED
jgi:hypothetical protein